MNIRHGQLGQLPFQAEHPVQQIERAYQQLLRQQTALQKNRYLHNLCAQYEPIFYQMMQKHLKSVLPFLYTPTVGEAVQTFNQNFLGHKGLYLAWPHRHHLSTLLDQYQSINIAVLTDGEKILGLGDQGVGGIEICMAKSMLYTIGAKISPRKILSIYVDVGTNNQALLEDPLYLGWKHPRIKGKDYDDFLNAIVLGLKERFPNIYIHWEDLALNNAQRLLQYHQDTVCMFNDDIQGTGIVTLASILNALKITDSTLEKQRIIIFGGGAAGIGIANQLCQALQQSGLTLTQAKSRLWILGRQGLLFENSENLTQIQRQYTRHSSERVHYQSQSHTIDLRTSIHHIKPTILIGCSGQAQCFTEEIIKTMAQYVRRPIILPLSNPSQNCEAQPEEIIRWTDGQALIATGSPFEDIHFKEQTYTIAQCNNALVFPGIALGALASGATRITEGMLTAACSALCTATKPLTHSSIPRLLPDISELESITLQIALAVFSQAYVDQVNTILMIEPVKNIQLQQWAIT